MTHVIEFYIPARFKTKPKGVTQEQPGKVIVFPSDRKKSA
jgi:hypothetical protein